MIFYCIEIKIFLLWPKRHCEPLEALVQQLLLLVSGRHGVHQHETKDSKHHLCQHHAFWVRDAAVKPWVLSLVLHGSWALQDGTLATTLIIRITKNKDMTKTKSIFLWSHLCFACLLIFQIDLRRRLLCGSGASSIVLWGTRTIPGYTWPNYVGLVF